MENTNRSQRALQVERLKLGVQAKEFLETDLYVELKTRLGEQIDNLNQAYWLAWKDYDDKGRPQDTAKKVSYLTGKRAGLTLLTDILNTIFVQGETAVFEIEKNKITEGHG